MELLRNVSEPALPTLRGGARIRQSLSLCPTQTGTEGRLTTSMIRRITGGWFKKAGIVKEMVDSAGNKVRREISAHSLRHTAAMLSLEKNVPLNDIQSMLRHKDISTTFLYLKRASRTKAMAEKSLDEI